MHGYYSNRISTIDSVSAGLTIRQNRQLPKGPRDFTCGGGPTTTEVFILFFYLYFFVKKFRLEQNNS